MKRAECSSIEKHSAPSHFVYFCSRCHLASLIHSRNGLSHLTLRKVRIDRTLFYFISNRGVTFLK